MHFSELILVKKLPINLSAYFNGLTLRLKKNPNFSTFNNHEGHTVTHYNVSCSNKTQTLDSGNSVLKAYCWDKTVHMSIIYTWLSFLSVFFYSQANIFFFRLGSLGRNHCNVRLCTWLHGSSSDGPNDFWRRLFAHWRRNRHHSPFSAI